ncbi:MAG: Crp/Fnr family transcriptional regulator [Pseudomonadota bacterium]|nr:Crp/Fnr family transcriptional regulator [Pseudomonadota bacterium]
MVNHFVQKLKSLVDLTAADVAALEVATSQTRTYAPRQDLIREGDRPGPVFVVLDGWACRYKMLPNGARQITAFLLPGDACDLHVGMLREMDHSLQAITLADVALIPGEEMDAMMEAHPGIARAMYEAQLIDEGTLRAWIVSMGRRSSIARVAHLMCELYLRIQSSDGGEAAALPISQVVLADALGMTPVHVNRVLRELRLAGAMALRRGSLTVIDPLKLVKIAGFDENYLHRRRDLQINPPQSH